jgi:hypothetical protein
MTAFSSIQDKNSLLGITDEQFEVGAALQDIHSALTTLENADSKETENIGEHLDKIIMRAITLSQKIKGGKEHSDLEDNKNPTKFGHD